MFTETKHPTEELMSAIMERLDWNPALVFDMLADKHGMTLSSLDEKTEAIRATHALADHYVHCAGSAEQALVWVAMQDQISVPARVSLFRLERARRC